MKIMQQAAGRLVLQEKPGLVLLVGGLFVIAGIVVAVGAGEPLPGIGAALLGAIVILAFGNTVTATFDNNIGRFTRATRGAVRNSEITHPLPEIAGVSVETSRASRGSPSYRIALELASGARVPLTTSYSSGKSGKEHSAAAIRKFLNLPEAPEVKMPGFGEMVKAIVDSASPREHDEIPRPSREQRGVRPSK